MVITRTYKTLLLPTEEQLEQLQRISHGVKVVWNWALAERIRAYQLNGETLWQRNLQGRLKEIRERYPDILQYVPSQSQLAVLMHQDRAMKRYFTKLKDAQAKGSKVSRGGKSTPGSMYRWFTKEELESGKIQYPNILGYPKFKTKRDQVGFKFFSLVEIEVDQIKLPKVGWVSIAWGDAGYLPVGKWTNQPRDYKDEDLEIGNRWFASGAVVQKNGKWYICVTVKEHGPDPNPQGPERLAVHRGVKHLATISTSDKTVKSFENPRHYRSAEKRLVRMQKKIARRAIGGNRRHNLQVSFNKLHEQIANRRIDTIHKLTTDITLRRQPHTIVIEEWNVHDLAQQGETLTFTTKKGKKIKVRNRRAAKGLLDSGIGMMNHQIKYKGEWAGASIETPKANFQSTKRCNKCGTINEGFDGRQKHFKCINPECGHREMRERNSSKNLLHSDSQAIPSSKKSRTKKLSTK